MRKPKARRSLRVEDELWEAGMAEAEAAGTYLPALIREWIADYVRRQQRHRG